MNIALREARRAAGLTQHALAQALGTNPTSIWRWEVRGDLPSLYFQQRICTFFRCSCAAFGWSVVPSSRQERAELTRQSGTLEKPVSLLQKRKQKKKRSRKHAPGRHSSARRR